MNTETYIANLALGQAGVAATIQSLDEQSAEAKRCRPHMQMVRTKTLEAFDWSFARVRGALAVHGDDPPDEWAVRYSMPANCVTFRRIWNPASKTVPVPFKRELSLDKSQQTIVTNMEEAVGIWTHNITDLSLTSAHFQHCMALLLGSIIAMPTSKNRNLKAELLMEFNRNIIAAPAFDDQQSADEERLPDWITER